MFNFKYFSLANSFISIDIVLCLSGIYAFLNFGSNDFVNESTILINILFTVVNVFILYLNKRIRSPFIYLVSFINIIYYKLRIVSLVIVPYSLALTQYRILDFENVNHTLFCVIFGNIAIFLAILFSSKNQSLKSLELIKYSPNVTTTILFIINIIVTIKAFDLNLPPSLYLILMIIIDMFANIYILMFLFIGYIILFYNRISNGHKILILITIIYYVIINSLIGSRSTILTLIQFFLIHFVFININPKLSVKSLFPVILVGFFSIFIYVGSSSIRNSQGYDKTTKVSTERTQNYSEAEHTDIMLLWYMQGLVSRLGSLDYAGQLISNPKPYSSVINFSKYFKSVIDNGLSPGFNIFNTPRASHSLRYTTERIKNNPTHKDVAKEYVSSMFTIYGEFYVLFGKYLYSIMIFIFTVFCYKLYSFFKTVNLKNFYIRSIVLLMFFDFINSFGLDWFLITGISYFLTFTVVGSLFYKKIILK